MTALTVDSRGRVTLGKAHAGKSFLVTQDGANLVLVPAETVPAKEAWLYKNPKAIAAVMAGLAQAAAGKLVDGPDLEASSDLADAIGDD